MEPYDPDRVPILFVHGIAGYPQEFAALIDSLDRTRYQAWFYFYPSGFGLQGISRHLSTLLIRLEVRYGFDQFGIVAHSMGGLVARGAILEYAEAARHDGVRLFVSVSTPWGGDPRAEIVDRSPIAMPESFDDMKPDSAYLRWLFYQAPTDGEDGSDAPAKRLPRGVAYHMVVGYRLPGSASQSGDGRVSLASQARLEVQRSALSVRAFDETHTGILSAPETLQHINALIEDRFD
jgi:pimeloyl-ACP methyl ester carboxylesterase